MDKQILFQPPGLSILPVVTMGDISVEFKGGKSGEKLKTVCALISIAGMKNQAWDYRFRGRRVGTGG